MDGLTDLSEIRFAEYQVVIVVDAENGRLNPLTQDIPRCLLPVANRPILSYQIDMLVKCGVKEVLIAAPSEYHVSLRQFQGEEVRENINIDLVFVDEMSGTIDALRAVSERIRGEFICLTADFISQINLSQIVNKHRLNISDFTMMLAQAPYEEPAKKGGSRIPLIDEEDHEIIGLDIDGRIVLKLVTLDLEESSLSIAKPIIHKCKQFNLRNNLIDVGVYVMSKWILEFLKSKKHFSCIRTDLIPYLIDHQFQSKRYYAEKMPAIIHRKRFLGTLDPWLIAIKNGSSTVDLATVLGKTLLNREEISSDSQDSREDLLRCFASVYEPSSTESKDQTIVRRVVNIKTYSSLNRDIHLSPHNPSVPWPRIDYLKKELSVIGQGCELGDKVTIQQCTIGPGTKIGVKSKLNNCIIMSGVNIGENCVIQNSVICSDVVIENNCNLNACEVGFGAKIPIGSSIKNEQVTNEDTLG